MGLNLSSVIRSRSIGIIAGHGFNRNWSVKGEVEIGMGKITEGYSDEEEMHYEELGRLNDFENESDIFTGTLSIQFWPKECYKGAYFSIGGKLSEGVKNDLTGALGYSIRIGSYIAIDLSFEIDMVASYRCESLKGNGSTIGINIIF